MRHQPTQTLVDWLTFNVDQKWCVEIDGPGKEAPALPLKALDPSWGTAPFGDDSERQ